MPEIGATLREARMRARIDISEIEAETKIRAKYLRALENEEWGLLPGPAYVRSFLRTYAEALGLDAKLLLEEYKLRYERPSDHDLMPIGTSRRRSGRSGGGPMRPPREPRRIPPGLVIGVIVLLLVAALYALGKWGVAGDDDGGGGTAASTTATDRTTTTKVPATSTTRTTKASGSSSSSKKKASSSKVVRLQIVASGTVFACLVDSEGTQRIKGVTLNDGQSAGPFRSRSFRLLLGNGNATVRVDGKVRTVPNQSPVAFRISKGKFAKVSPSSVPNCG
jgi:transcriptional regulator with XRE-family HTH domain